MAKPEYLPVLLQLKNDLFCFFYCEALSVYFPFFSLQKTIYSPEPIY